MDAHEMSPDQLLTKEDVAALLSVSVGTLKGWAASGFGPKKIQLGPRAIRYRLRDVLDFVETRATA